ncbi:MAG: hypothetical protein ACXVP8_10040 [Actinomycetota bacterium]
MCICGMATEYMEFSERNQYELERWARSREAERPSGNDAAA